jgi:NDP-4-keto-2,6-dideoxyhexose 3-C-methyltransferase
MNDDSLFVLQMTYLESMYSENIFDNVVHEHVTYFSLKSLKFVAELAGLKVIGARVVASYGGSLRVFLVRNTSSKTLPGLAKETKEIIAVESMKSTEDPETLAKFGDSFEIWKNNLKQVLDNQVKRFGPIIGMGASTKGNMILQSLEIKEDVMPFIMDNNLKKIGSRTTGSFIPIVGEESVLDLNPNVMSLPYYYDEFFKNILRKKIKEGEFVDFISPLPNPSVTRILGN